MTRAELIAQLRECERKIHTLNERYQSKLGERPSVADPAVCARRNELREMLIERRYDPD